MRNQNWLKIWENKARSDVEDSHKVDGWDLLSVEEYRELVYSCLVGNEQDLLNPDLNMIELGCGSGAFIEALKLKYPLINIRGADYSPKLIKLACAKFRNLKFDLLDMMSTKLVWEKTLGTKPFDVIFSYSTLYYLDEIKHVEEVLKKMLFILSKTGKIIIGEINDNSAIKEANNVRKISHKERKIVSKDIDADHLYLPKELFISFAEENNLVASFLSLPEWYPASKYRYHVILEKN